VRLFHFTHISHVSSVCGEGLVCDSAVGARLLTEAGEPDIKVRRRTIRVPAEPGGVVADYVPFYFAPRSPMLFRIHRGGVPTYTGGQSDLVYVCTTVERLQECGVALVFTDRNAATSYAAFRADSEDWRAAGFIDWPLMGERYWSNDAEHPDRKERRMSECLAHTLVPWHAVQAIGVRDENAAERVQTTLAGADHQPRVLVRPAWYF
jgi:hypothetical protein